MKKSEPNNINPDWSWDLGDVPALSGPIMPEKAFIVIPDYDRLEKAYRDANWQWCLESGGMRPPSAAEIRRDVEESLKALGSKPGDYCQFGGLLIFRAKSGKPGMALEGSVGEHWKAGARGFVLFQRHGWKLCSEELPDSDLTVLGYNAGWSDVVWPCYLDGATWRAVDGLALLDQEGDGSAPTHWIDFPEPPEL